VQALVAVCWPTPSTGAAVGRSGGRTDGHQPSAGRRLLTRRCPALSGGLARSPMRTAPWPKGLLPLRKTTWTGRGRLYDGRTSGLSRLSSTESCGPEGSARGSLLARVAGSNSFDREVGSDACRRSLLEPLLFPWRGSGSCILVALTSPPLLGCRLSRWPERERERAQVQAIAQGDDEQPTDDGRVCARPRGEGDLCGGAGRGGSGTPSVEPFPVRCRLSTPTRPLASLSP